MTVRQPRSLRTTRALVGLAFAAFALAPLAWMLVSGFKANREVLATPFHLLPAHWLGSNFVQILEDPAFARTLGVTFGGAVAFTISSVVVNSMAAYAFARLEFRFKRVLWPIVIGTMFIPNMAILLTSFVMVTKLRMLDTMAVLIIPGIASAALMFFVRQFYLSVPLALEEAARIDGASRWQIFVKIFVPLSQPVYVVVGVISFMAYWNAYVWPIMTITSPELYQVQQYLADFRVSRGPELGLLMAGSFLAALPVIVLVLIFQRRIIGGIKIAGLK
ncbi:MAG: carbohydrate ABC transporter permease [Janthinobacterium lividum]